MLNVLTTLLEVSLGCGVVIALLLLLAPALSKRFSPRLRYWAWALLAVRLLLPGMPWGQDTLPAPIQFDTPEALIQSAYRPQQEFDADRNEYYYPNAVNPAPNSMYRDQDEYYLSFSDNKGNSYEIRNDWHMRTVTVNGEVAQQNYHWPTILFSVWLYLAVISLLVELAQCHHFRKRLLRWSVPASKEDQAALEEQQQALGVYRWVSLVRSDTVSSPLLMGFIKPTIVLPAQLPEHTLAPSLAHELTHLKRGDLWYQLLLLLARCVHWFNPLVWLMVRQAKRDMELCCDYDLLQSRDKEARRSYGQAILDQMTAGRGVSPLTTGFSGDKKSIFTRFNAIMDTAPKKKGTAVLVLILCGAILAGGLVSCGSSAESMAIPPEQAVTVSLPAPNWSPISITANYYEHGFDWDYDALPILNLKGIRGDLDIQLPASAAGPIRISVHNYYPNTTQKETLELFPDETGRITVPLARADQLLREEKAYLFLTWGENSKFRYVFQVDFIN